MWECQSCGLSGDNPVVAVVDFDFQGEGIVKTLCRSCEKEVRFVGDFDDHKKWWREFFRKASEL